MGKSISDNVSADSDIDLKVYLVKRTFRKTARF